MSDQFPKDPPAPAAPPPAPEAKKAAPKKAVSQSDDVGSDDGAGSDDKAKPELVQAVVAPRRTVHDGVGARGPGSVVYLPAKEVSRLRGLGYLLPTDGELVVPVDGPSVNNESSDIVKPK